MSIARGTKITDAQRRAQNKYEAATYKTVTCKLPKEFAERFIKAVEADPSFIIGGRDKGSVNAALTSFIMEYMANH